MTGLSVLEIVYCSFPNATCNSNCLVFVCISKFVALCFECISKCCLCCNSLELISKCLKPVAGAAATALRVVTWEALLGDGWTNTVTANTDVTALQIQHYKYSVRKCTIGSQTNTAALYSEYISDGLVNYVEVEN